MNFLKSKKIYLCVAAIIVVIAAFLIFSQNRGKKSEVVARVGEAEITKEELYDSMVEYYGYDVLDSMIADKIIELEAKKSNIAVTEAEIQEEMDSMIESYGGEESFNAQLEYAGVTLEDVKADMEMYLKTIKLLESRIVVTDEEISAYFEENKEDFIEEGQTEANLEDHRDTIEEILRNEKVNTEYSVWLAEKYEEYDVYNSLEP